MSFTRNKIKDGEESVAEKLRTAREEKNITIETAAKKLNINPDYLLALESGDYSRLPAGVYEKTYLKKYGAYLGLNHRSLEKGYAKEKSRPSQTKNDVFAKKKIRARELLVFPKILRNVFIIIFLVSLFLYLGYYLKNSFSLPELTITSPSENLVTENNLIEVAGKTSPKTQITINNRQILKDESGNFRETVELKKGLNTITVSAQNKYSPKKIIERQILVK